MDDRSSRLGFVGLGTMGLPMAGNLLRAGFAVLGYDPHLPALAALRDAGGESAGSVGEVVDGSDIVLFSLPTGEAFLNVFNDEVMPRLREGQVFIELGTSSPPAVARLAEAVRERGARLLDVPVSGGAARAANGTLHLFIGGDLESVERCRPLFEILGDPAHTTYCGVPGNGQVVKGVNQLAMGLINAALLEAVAYGVGAGVDPTTLAEALAGDEGWRKLLVSVAQRVADGQGRGVEVKYRELHYWLDHVMEDGRDLPLTAALHEFVGRGQPVVDEHGHRVPSFWNELTKGDL